MLGKILRAFAVLIAFLTVTLPYIIDSLGSLPYPKLKAISATLAVVLAVCVNAAKTPLFSTLVAQFVKVFSQSTQAQTQPAPVQISPSAPVSTPETPKPAA